MKIPLLPLSTAVLLAVGCASAAPIPVPRHAATPESRAALQARTGAVVAEAQSAIAARWRLQFTRPGATAQEFDADKWACDRDLGRLRPSLMQLSAEVEHLQAGRFNAAVVRCLEVKGWVLQ